MKISWTLRILILAALMALPGASPARADDERAITPGASCATFEVYGAMSTDRDGAARGIGLPEARELLAPVAKSPYAKYANLGWLTHGQAVVDCFEALPFRLSDGDDCSVELLRRQLEAFTPDTAIIMDSGGAHSVAMAAALLEAKNYQPIWMFGGELHAKGVDAVEQDLASLKYQAPAFRAARAHARADAPPVFIMNEHRGDMVFESDYDNRSILAEADFPKADEFKAQNIKRVLWITEGRTDSAPVRLSNEAFTKLLGVDAEGKDKFHDPGTVLKHYAGQGLEIYRLKISPYSCPYSVSK